MSHRGIGRTGISGRRTACGLRLARPGTPRRPRRTRDPNYSCPRGMVRVYHRRNVKCTSGSLSAAADRLTRTSPVEGRLQSGARRGSPDAAHDRRVWSWERASEVGYVTEGEAVARRCNDCGKAIGGGRDLVWHANCGLCERCRHRAESEGRFGDSVGTTVVLVAMVLIYALGFLASLLQIK